MQTRACASPRCFDATQLRRVSWAYPSIAGSRAVVAAAAAATPRSLDLNALYSSETAPAAFVGPVTAVRQTAGTRLEAARSLDPGEPLLVVPPLALRSLSEEEVEEAAAAAAAGDALPDAATPYAPTDDDVDDLVAQLSARLQRGDAVATAWLPHLAAAASPAAARSTAPPPDLASLAALARNGTAAAAPESAAAQQQKQQQQQQTGGDDAGGGDSTEQLLDIVDVAVRALPEDVALCALADATPRTLVGLWPELVMLPHSCCPNASLVLHQGAAVVVAARPVPKGSLVTVNLIGSSLFAPLSVRRAALTALTGECCSCPRCRDEARLDASLLQLVGDISEACSAQAGPELAAAAEADDDDALSGLATQLSAFAEVLDAAFSKTGVKQQSQFWLQASLLQLYELAAVASAAAGGCEPQLLELLAALAAETAPGSAQHVFWTAQLRAELAEEEDARFDGGLRAADAALAAACAARYGAGLRQALRQKLVAAATADGA